MAVGFMLLAPILIGCVDLGRAYFAYDILVHGVNEGVRIGTFTPNTDAIVAAVRAASTSLNLQSGDVAVTCYSGSSPTTKACTSMVTGDSVKVGATVLFTPITPLIGNLLPGGTLTVGATAQRSFQ
jgi:hypothetical protein